MKSFSSTQEFAPEAKQENLIFHYFSNPFCTESFSAKICLLYFPVKFNFGMLRLYWNKARSVVQKELFINYSESALKL